ELLGFLPRGAVRSDVGLCEAAHGGPDRGVLLGLEQVRHRRASIQGLVVGRDMQNPSVPARLRRSRHLSWFAHMGAVYLFHDLYGYLMEMSPDIAAMIEAFSDGVDTEETIQ